MDILSKLKKERLYFDGGYGTMLQAKGLGAGELPELWNITHSDIVESVHTEYLKAGSDVVTTNTFGANSLKFSGKDTLPSLEKVVSAALKNAKNAVKAFGAEDKYVALDIGPTGKLLKPLGDLEFEDAVKIFAEVVKLGVKYGADLIIIETMNDSHETKAAVLAAKENSNLPVFVTNVYDESSKLMTGASPEAMVAMLEGLGVDALGINCSLGPDKMLPIVKRLTAASSIPVIVNPNAGLPVFVDGKTQYEVTPQSFADTMAEIAELGARVLGGCCGTTPEHIRCLKMKTKELAVKPITPKKRTVISSYTHAVTFGELPILIGERINPTGKPLFKAALRENNFDYVLEEGVSQQELGASVLDVNVGLPEIDETKVLAHCVKLLQSVSDLPLQIDTANAEAMEAALRVYNGKPLINSVNGKEEVMEEIFPLAAKYGGVIIGLTLDEGGIPQTADRRIEIAQKIIERAKKYNISKENIIIDPLAMTISSDSSSALVTLECIERLTRMGIKTSLGVSNVSFGLPQRGIINKTFFTMALRCGLSAAIMNPHAKEMMDSYFGFCALSDMDPVCGKYIEYASKFSVEQKALSANDKITPEDELKRAVIKGLKDEAAASVKKLLGEAKPLEIIDGCIIPALEQIGKAFEEKTAFLPQLLMSAEAAKAAFDVLKESLSAKSADTKKYKIVIATVKGDIHDIGKNIVKVLLENYNYDVYDLGKDVEPELIAETAISHNAPLVGLSALMTTTVVSMEKTIKIIHERFPSCKVVVGGAVLTQEYADMIGADKYAKDAMETVRYAESLLQGGK